MELPPQARLRRPPAPSIRRAMPPRLARLLDDAIGSLHVTPDFLIIGAARAGTTSLLEHLKAHPGTLFASDDELHHFDTGLWKRGPGAYRRAFPWRAQQRVASLRGRGPALTGESSPYYLAHPAAPARAHAALPDARLIALLRDPTDRAVSHWAWNTIEGVEDRPFGEVVETELAEIDALGDTPAGLGAIVAGDLPRRRRYLARGLYRGQLERWLAHYPREQLLVELSERYFADPRDALGRVWRHLGLPPGPVLDVERNARSARALRRQVAHPPIDAAAVERVRAWFRPHNEALAAYLGAPLPWE